MRQVDVRLGLSRAVAAVLEDRHRPERCRHTLISLLQQRLYGLTLGYDDLNDHEQLRQDLANANGGGR